MIDKTTCAVSYRGGEEQSVFPIPFPFLETGHIRARVRDADGNETTLAAGVDYAVNSISDSYGELVLLGTDLPADSVLTISRRLPLTQDILFHNQGPNSPAVIEEALDKLTMISQQLQAELDNCLSAPVGASAEELAVALVASASTAADLRREVSAVAQSVAGKAAAAHAHAIAEVGDLAVKLAAKVDVGHSHPAADIHGLAAQLSAKAAAVHGHGVGEVAGLAAALADKAASDHTHAAAVIDGLPALLAEKLDAGDPRLDAVGNHASSHAATGADPLTPEAIGALPAPPSTGKTYLATGGGWVEYIAPANGGESAEGVGSMDHSQLLNRDAADQHPQAAIRNLSQDLALIRASLADLAEADLALGKVVADKADRGDLPGPATASADGLLSSADKIRLDAIPEEIPVLPGGASAGAHLVAAAAGGLEWRDAASVAGCLPLMTVSQKGVARLAGAGGIELDAGGALRIASDNLVSKANIEARLATLDGKADAAETRLSGQDGRLNGLDAALAGMGSMAAASDAPANGKPHLRQNGDWIEYVAPSGSSSGSSSGGAAAIAGEIRLLPFRNTDLPPGWYFCNGDRFAATSVQGAALLALPETFRSDWGISVADAAVSLPNLFGDGGGYFLRAVDNVSRLPGSTQGDAMRNIAGSVIFADLIGCALRETTLGSSTLSGPFHADAGGKTMSFARTTYGENKAADMHFDASRCVPVADEIRPANIGMTPAIYLGV